MHGAVSTVIQCFSIIRIRRFGILCVNSRHNYRLFHICRRKITHIFPCIPCRYHNENSFFSCPANRTLNNIGTGRFIRTHTDINNICSMFHCITDTEIKFQSRRLSRLIRGFHRHDPDTVRRMI